MTSVIQPVSASRATVLPRLSTSLPLVVLSPTSRQPVSGSEAQPSNGHAAPQPHHLAVDVDDGALDQTQLDVPQVVEEVAHGRDLAARRTRVGTTILVSTSVV